MFCISENIELIKKIQLLLNQNSETYDEVLERIKSLLLIEAKYKAIFNSLSAGIVFNNKNGQVTEINEVVTKILNYQMDDFEDKSKNPRQTVIKPDGSPFLEDDQPGIIALKSGKVVENSIMGVPEKHGDLKWLLTNAYPVYNNEQNLIGSIAIINDISANIKKELELEKKIKSLQITEKTFLKAQALVRFGYWQFNIQNQKTSWSDEMYLIFEMNKCEDEDINFYTILKEKVHPDDLQKLENRVHSVDEGKIPPPTEYRIVTKKGIKEIRIEEGELILDENGEVYIITGIAIDITEQKESERRKFQQQKSDNEKKISSLQLLAGGIAHDFNNLLSGIFGYIDLARNETNEPKTLNYLSNTVKSIDRARYLANQFLTFTNTDMNREICHVTDTIFDIPRYKIMNPNIKFEIQLPDVIWYCYANKIQIGQVLENILLNAVQSMNGEGIVSIKVDNVTFEKNTSMDLIGNFVKISISDMGSGMSEETLSHLFEPFFTTKSTGHGLGLSISHSIMKNHNGAIKVETELQKGTTFSIYVPAMKESEVKEVHEITHFNFPHTGEGLILVLDDEVDIRNIMKINLNKFGYSVLTTDDGNEIINWLKTKKNVRGIFLDLTIPNGLGGMEIIEELRVIDQKIPIFVSSGFGNNKVINNPKSFGFTASIRKPFSRAELEEFLNQYCILHENQEG